MEDNRILKEYIQEALNELKFNPSFFKKRKKDNWLTRFLNKIGTIKSSNQADWNDEDSESPFLDRFFGSGDAEEVQIIIKDWIKELEDLEEEPLDNRVKNSLSSYAEKVYAKMLKKYKNPRKASKMTKRALDVQYAKFKATS